MSSRSEALPRMRTRVDPGIAALLTATTIWGATYVVTKSALTDVGPMMILLARCLIGAICLAPFAYRKGFRLRDSFKAPFVLFGFTGIVLHLGLEIGGLEFTSASSAALIVASAPAVIAGLSVIFLKERMTIVRFGGVALSIAGVVLVTRGASSETYPLAWLGNLMVFGGVFTWGVFTIQGKRISMSHPWQVSTTAAMVAATLMTIPLAGAELAFGGPMQITPGAIAAVLYLGAGASAAAYGLWNLALHHVDASVAGPYVNLVPVIGVTLAVAIGETIGPWQIVGGVVVALGVWLSHRSSRSQVEALGSARAKGAI
jgi:drug/metabolite transporter (DMT)-like permease